MGALALSLLYAVLAYQLGHWQYGRHEFKVERNALLDAHYRADPVPVTDVDRAKAFYERVGFNADHDFPVREGLRFVQLTPPGSACSIVIGEGITEKTPGTQEIQIVVADAETARKQLLDAEVQASDVEVLPWGRFVHFRDPDGNKLCALHRIQQ